MKGVNKAIILGTVGKDPEMRNSQNGNAMTSLSLATSEKWKDKVSGQVQEKTEWHRVQFFGKLAEIVGQYVNKGSQIYVEGKITTRKWTDKEGIERYSTEIIADTMQMVGSKGQGNESRPSQQQSIQPEFDDSDIPF